MFLLTRTLRPFLTATALVLLTINPGAAANATASAGQSDADAAMQERYAPFQELLTRYLYEQDLPEDGLVSAFDYAAALEDEELEALLDEQNRRLARYDPEHLASREEAVAFWLNAYNYFMIAHILDNPRGGELIASVRDYGHLFNPYRVFRQELFDVGGKRYSLDEIEKGILLGDVYKERGWKEARVHFAVNCASVGCPPLRAMIYLPSGLDATLTENTRRALNTSHHLRLDGSTLRLSRLFDWYEQDYVKEAGSVREFIAQYADPHIRQKLTHSDRIRFIDYDWALNKPENFPEFQ